MGHIIRAEDSDITRNVTFAKNEPTLLPFYIGKYRHGGPRKRWTEETMAATWSQIRKTSVQYTGNRMQRQKIKTAALNRDAPFKTKPPKKVRNIHDSNSRLVSSIFWPEEGEDWMDNDWARHFW